MSKEICISSTPHETRLAILEDEQLTEVYYERENEYTLAGSIYQGRVTRVLPGMQSAFVDLGLERDAFLYVTDFMEEQEDSSEFERIPGNGEAPEAANHKTARHVPLMRARAEEEPAPRRNGAPAGPSCSFRRRGQPAGEFEDGTRRWRGRRGRRKGFRPPARRAAGRSGTNSSGPRRGTPAGRVTGRTRGHREAPTCGVCSSG